MLTGTGVIKVRKDNGYGFIASDQGGKDLFFHVKDLARGTREDQMAEGARVGFEVREGDRGPMACKVYVLLAEPEQQPEAPQVTVAEAFKGFDQALLAVVEWRDLIESLVRDRA